MSQPLKRSLHNGLNKVSGSESRLCPLPCPPRGWPRLRSSPPRRRWRATRPLCRRRRTPTRGRGRPGDRTPRPKIVAPLALPGPALPPTNVWGVGGCIDPACLLARVDDQQHREKGKAHQAAVRALACTGMRLLSRCWQERTPSEESTSLQALTRRGSSLLQSFAKVSWNSRQKILTAPLRACVRHAPARAYACLSLQM